MHETKLRGVEHRSWRVDERPAVIAHVDPLAHDGMSRFGKVDADLVRASRFEAAGDERGPRQASHALDVRDRELPLATEARASAQSITTVGDEVAAQRPRRDVAVGDGEVATVHRVRAELSSE